MKNKKIIAALILLIILISMTASTVSAAPLGPPMFGPKEICNGILNGIYDADKQICYWRTTDPFPNICYPLWDKAVWAGIGYMFGGCVNLRNTGITSPTGGYEFLFPSTFTYDPGTCAGRCKVTTTTITGDAKAALGDLPGKVIGKAYVQILDLEGNPTTGNFKLCLKAKNAKNPAFFRYTKSGWQYFGGYWSGKKFCMSGDTSGNYVLVDVKE